VGVLFQGAAVVNITSLRVDEASKLVPNSGSPGVEGRFAKAEGLTVDEALDLVAWLKDSGYARIEVINETDHCSVLWTK
jgi:hypothetical protein